MTEKEIAKLAVLAQDACNLSGIVHDWSKCLNALWDIARERGKGTDWVNQHPSSKLFADKAADLARVRQFDQYSTAYDACHNLVAETASA